MADYIFQSNDSLQGQALLNPDIVYSRQEGVDLVMDILSPWRIESGDDRIYPCVVFVQGSGFQTADLNFEIPQLSILARKGFVIATIRHRDAFIGHPAPAYLEDTKSAIRYLRANSETYHIDKERLAIWGTSSGGNTALMVALTGDAEKYKNDVYPEESDAVTASVACFGVHDLEDIYENVGSEVQEMVDKLCPGSSPEEKANCRKEFSPLYRLDDAKNVPPMLLLHGDSDLLVPVEHSINFDKKAKEMGFDSKLAIVEGADHESNFWSDEVYQLIFDFLIEGTK